MPNGFHIMKFIAILECVFLILEIVLHKLFINFWKWSRQFNNQFIILDDQIGKYLTINDQ